PAQRIDEVADVGHPVLEQIAHPARTIGQQLGGVSLLDVLGEHQHAHRGPLLPHHQRGPEALVGEGRRHAHVDHHDVGALRIHGAEKALRAAWGGDHVVARVDEQPGESLTEEDRVLGDHDAHGSSTWMTVGPPGGLSMRRWPSTPATRSASPERPPPVGSAPPTPSSRTLMLSTPATARMSTEACRARACLATLASDSATTK